MINGGCGPQIAYWGMESILIDEMNQLRLAGPNAMRKKNKWNEMEFVFMERLPLPFSFSWLWAGGPSSAVRLVSLILSINSTNSLCLLLFLPQRRERQPWFVFDFFSIHFISFFFEKTNETINQRGMKFEFGGPTTYNP